MGRNINVATRGEIPELHQEGTPATTQTAPDNYTSQIVKLIPADLVGVYLGVQNVFASLNGKPQFYAQCAVFLIILVIAPFYLKKVAGMTDGRQRMVSIISYFVWALSLGGPFAYLLEKIHSPYTAQMIGGSLVALYTLAVPLLYQPKKSV
jgi:hypothetical protein